MNHTCFRNARLTVSVACLLVANSLIGCGHEAATPQSATISASTANDSRYNARFSEIDALALLKMKLIVKSWENAAMLKPPTKFLQEFGEYSVAAEIKAFIPITLSTTESQSRLIRGVEEMSKWTEVKDSTGKQMYNSVETVATDFSTSVDENADGQAPIEGETRYAKIAAPSPSGEMKFVISTLLSNDNGLIKCQIRNATAINVNAGFMTINGVETNGMYNIVELYPFRNGYLVYAAGRIKAANRMGEDNLRAKDIETSVLGTLDWVKQLLSN